jgi:hypothetical protein
MKRISMAKRKEAPIPGIYCPLCAQKGIKSSLVQQDKVFWTINRCSFCKYIPKATGPQPLNEIQLNTILNPQVNFPTKPQAERDSANNLIRDLWQMDQDNKAAGREHDHRVAAILKEGTFRLDEIPVDDPESLEQMYQLVILNKMTPEQVAQLKLEDETVAQFKADAELLMRSIPRGEQMPDNYKMALYILGEGGVPLSEIPLNDKVLLSNMYDRAVLSRREHMAVSPEANRFRDVIEPVFTRKEGEPTTPEENEQFEDILRRGFGKNSHTFSKLTKIANQIDCQGAFDVADEIDKIIIVGHF